MSYIHFCRLSTRRTFLLVFFIFKGFTPLWSQDTLHVTVIASRSAIPALIAPLRITHLDASHLSKQSFAALSEVLGRNGVFDIRAYGATGSAGLSMRGASTSQTLVLLDGFSVNHSQLGQADLSVIPVAALGGVEVLHGAASALYGSSAMGGTVFLHPTNTETKGWSANLSGGMAAFGERAAQIQVAFGHKNIHSRLTIRKFHTDGDFPYSSIMDNTATTQRRVGSVRDDDGLMASVGGKFGKHRIQLNTWLLNNDRQLPSPIDQAPMSESQQDQSQRIWLTDRFQMGKSKIQAGIMAHETQIRYQNPTYAIDDLGLTRALEGRLVAENVLSPKILLFLGIEAKSGTAHHPSIVPNSREKALAAFMSGVIKAKQTTIFPALRLDQAKMNEQSSTAFTQSFGLNRPLFKLGGTWLHTKASWGTVFRMPTFNDRFWQFGGNPDLKPERGWQTDTGLAWQKQQTEIELTAFLHRIQDQIAWAPNEIGAWQPQNIARVHAQGLEASAKTVISLTTKFSLHIGGHYTHTQSQDHANPTAPSFGKQIRYVPLHQGQMQLGGQYGHWQLSAIHRYTGKRFISADESSVLPSFGVLNAQLQHTFTRNWGHLGLLISLENATNAQYAILQNYPMPPRFLRFSARLSLHTAYKR